MSGNKLMWSDFLINRDLNVEQVIIDKVLCRNQDQSGFYKLKIGAFPFK